MLGHCTYLGTNAMKPATAAVERANLLADVTILTEMVAYLFAQCYATASSEIELERLPERITNRMDELLELLKNTSPQARADAAPRYWERLQSILSAVNAYRKSGSPS
jgi:hypothetical protein